MVVLSEDRSSRAWTVDIFRREKSGSGVKESFTTPAQNIRSTPSLSNRMGGVLVAVRAVFDDS